MTKTTILAGGARAAAASLDSGARRAPRAPTVPLGGGRRTQNTLKRASGRLPRAGASCARAHPGSLKQGGGLSFSNMRKTI